MFPFTLFPSLPSPVLLGPDISHLGGRRSRRLSWGKRQASLCSRSSRRKLRRR